MEMDETALLAACKQHHGYQTPHLNQTLYCNFKGFGSLACLEAYTGLRALFLEGNALESTAGLPPLPELRCLFLQQNLLRTLTPGSLAAQPRLTYLNLSGNQLRGLEGLEGCGALCTLLAADNCLAEAAALDPLVEGCPALETLDLQNNKLEGGEAVLAACARLPALKCLYLKGNPLVSSMRSYRKATIAAIPTLTYLDDRPVFEVERLSAEAWARGGVEAEREARAAHRQREQEGERRRVAALRELRQAGWKKKREAMGLAGSGDPDLPDLPDDWEPDDEPAELRETREQLAAFTAGRQLQQGEQEVPGLADADVQAVLEESRANQAQLQQGVSCFAPAAIIGAAQTKAENSCPNSGGARPDALPAAAAGTTPEPEVPQAKVTVSIQASGAGGQEAGGAHIIFAAGQQAQQGSAAWCGAEVGCVEPATDSDDEGGGSASVSEDDDLTALD